MTQVKHLSLKRNTKIDNYTVRSAIWLKPPRKLIRKIGDHLRFP